MVSTGRRTAGVWICLALASLVAGYAVLTTGTPIAGAHLEARDAERIAAILTGLLGLIYWFVVRRRKPVPELGPWIEWPVVLLPLYGLVQIVPLPLGLVRVISPARAALSDPLSILHIKPSFVTLSVTPSATLHQAWVMGMCSIVFVVVYGLSARLKGYRWAPVIPLLILGTIEGLIGVLQVAQGHKASSGTFQIRTHLSGFVEMVLPFAVLFPVARFRSAETRGARLDSTVLACFSAVAAGVMILASASSLSRMGFFSMLTSLGAVAMAALLRGRDLRRAWLKVAAVLVVAGLAVVLLPSEQFVQRVEGDGLALEGRAFWWRETLSVIRAYPLFGCGLGSWKSAIVSYRNSMAMFDPDYAHSDYLQYLAELGILGTILAAVPLVVVVRRLWRGWRQRQEETEWLALACAGALLAMGMHSAVDFNLNVPANMFTLAWILGIAAYIGVPGSGSEEVKVTAKFGAGERISYRR